MFTFDAEVAVMARLARADLFDPTDVAVFHCIQRCVRQCYLCGCDAASGRSFDHRKQWLEERLRLLAGCFGIDVLAFAILSNHFHVVLRNRPDVVAEWSDEEAASRWLRLCPQRRLPSGEPAEPSDGEIGMIVRSPARLAEIRLRLSSMSWFMRMIAEPIARRANQEDAATGRFWEGRFKSVKLCDEAAILACCAYVELNPIRAGIASTPEASDFTSVQRRLQARAESTERIAIGAAPASELSPRPDDWLAPVSLEETSKSPGSDVCEPQPPTGDVGEPSDIETNSPAPPADRWPARCSNKGFLPLTLDEYLELVDWTGRRIVPGKSGAIDAAEQPILRRLAIEPCDWLHLTTRFGRLFARIAGRPHSARAQRHHRTHRRFRVGPARLLGEASAFSASDASPATSS